MTDIIKGTESKVFSKDAIQKSIVEALSKDYFDVYYVDVETGEYIEYGSWTREGQRDTEKRGNDFFKERLDNAKDYVFEEDLEHFLVAIDKDNLLEEIRKQGSFFYSYRLMIDGDPTYVIMKATRLESDDRHIIIGISNVDAQVKDRLAAERAEEERKIYQRINALNGDLIALYYVDPESEEFTEFSSQEGYSNLGIENHGKDFFRTLYENSVGTIHPDDQPDFNSTVTKSNLLGAIERDGIFVMDYRLNSNDLPTHVRMKAAKVEENGRPILIIGILDEDKHVMQEQERERDLSVAKSMALIDPLTGIKNKHAYVEWEEKIDAKIENGQQEEFAVVVCDINGLKAVNDQNGHKQGDECIINACKKICRIFSHSPVFRVGGDEFVALLTGDDYNRRTRLMEQVNAVPQDHSLIRIGETISAGMVEYRKNQHFSLMSIFEEADRAMYERKQYLKVTCLSEEHNDDIKDNEDLSTAEIPFINMRKKILIADDIESNREVLGDLLREEYDIMYASDGVEALEILHNHKEEIALVLLDFYMPNMNGREVITEMQVDEDLVSIPVIFLTIAQDAELDCLKIGAMDFIPKPYPDIEIVKARIAKCIELSEGRELIRLTERDKLTGLLNKDYFFRYVNRLDQIYKETTLDAVVCDVNRFYSINKDYGRRFGEQVLHTIGISFRKLARETGGIGGRQGTDTFMLYCPHQNDIEQLLKKYMEGIFADKETADIVRLRFGVFTDAQQEDDVEERFVCAKLAADKIKDDPDKICGYYE